MIAQDMINRLYDCPVVDTRGEKIGSVKRVWLDGQTGDPLWASVHTGLFGLKESFVPLQRAEIRENQVRVPVDKAQVKDSPKIEASHDTMTDDEQTALYQHYGVGQQATGSGDRSKETQRDPGTNQQPDRTRSRTEERPRSRADERTRTQRDGPNGMTRSEEHLKVGTERVETGRVRLVKHVVTEDQQVRVPVSHEEVRVERAPITDANRADAMRGEPLRDAAQEMTLHAEKPVVGKETAPMEQVRLTKDEVPDEETVSETVRKEKIEVQDDRDRRRR